MDATRNNNFGALRLIFASLVLYSHTPQMIHGSRKYEILYYIFGNLTLAEIAVDAFFIISGYLITQSFENSSSVWSYSKKRVLRIFPGYLVVFWICVLIVAPLAGAGLSGFNVSTALTGLLANIRLMPPNGFAVFPGLPFPSLNGSLWTIAYEFRCYIIVLIAGSSGLLSERYKIVFPLVAAFLLSINALEIIPKIEFPGSSIIGYPRDDVRFFGLFVCGMTFYLYRARIYYRHWTASLSAACLLVGMTNRITAEASFAIFGGYMIFWAAFRVKALLPSVFTASFDISYGVYLYAWPVQSIIIYYVSRDSFVVSLISSAIVAVIAFASWFVIERPALDFARRQTQSRRAQSAE
ncbi:acyltransferase family protein [Siculibacillus lacustris]